MNECCGRRICFTLPRMAQQTASGTINRIRARAEEKRQEAAALEAHADAIDSVSGPGSLAEALERVMDSQPPLSKALAASDVGMASVQALVETVEEVHDAAKETAGRAAKTLKQLRRHLDKASGQKKERASTKLLTPTNDPRVLGSNEDILAAFGEATGPWGASTESKFSSAWRRLIEISEESGSDIEDVNVEASVVKTMRPYAGRIIAWLHASREAARESLGDSGDTDSADTADTPRVEGITQQENESPTPAADHKGAEGLEQPDDGAVPLEDEQEADAAAGTTDPVASSGSENEPPQDGGNAQQGPNVSLSAVAADSGTPAIARFAALAGLARCSPDEIMTLTHQDIRRIDGEYVATRPNGETLFNVDDELYNDICKQTGVTEGLLFTRLDGQPISKGEIGQMILEATTRLGAVPTT